MSYWIIYLFIFYYPGLSLYEGVDVNAATEHGIKVARIPGDATGNAASCAEMAIYLMMGLLRKQVGCISSISLESSAFLTLMLLHKLESLAYCDQGSKTR